MHRDLTGAMALTLTTLLMATPALAQDADRGISVTDEGDEPRVELRYAWTEGLSETTVSVADTTAIATLNGIPESESQTSISSTVVRTVTEVDSDGVARVEFSVDGPERPDALGLWLAEVLPGEGMEALQAELAEISDYSGWMSLDARGVLLDYGVDGLSEAHAEVLVQTRGLGGDVLVLPEEPVGVGATWDSYAEVFATNLEFESETTTTLVAMEGSDLTLEQTYSAASEPNLGLERAFVTAGAIYSSQELEGSSTTNLSLDGLAQTGAGEIQLSVIAGTSAGGYGTEAEVDLDMAITASAGE